VYDLDVVIDVAETKARCLGDPKAEPDISSTWSP
jgi:hypothetical protein